MKNIKKLDKDSDGWAGGMVIISTEKKKLEAWKKSFLLVGFRLNALYAIFFVCLLLVYFLDFVIIFVLIYFCLQVVMLFRIWFLVVSSTDITWTEFVWYQSTIKVCLFFGSECCGFFFRFLQARSQGQSLTDQCGVSVSVFLSCFVVGFRIGSRRTWSHGRSILISAEPLLHSKKLSFIFL